MTRADLEIALHALGQYIGRIDDCPTNAEFLTTLKHAYLRINHFLVKTSNVSRRESRATIRAIKSLRTDHPISPGWLPCHKLPAQDHLLPCIHPDDVCHCAKLLQCNLDEDDIFSSQFQSTRRTGTKNKIGQGADRSQSVNTHPPDDCSLPEFIRQRGK